MWYGKPSRTERSKRNAISQQRTSFADGLESPLANRHHVPGAQVPPSDRNDLLRAAIRPGGTRFCRVQSERSSSANSPKRVATILTGDVTISLRTLPTRYGKSSEFPRLTQSPRPRGGEGPATPGLFLGLKPRSHFANLERIPRAAFPAVARRPLVRGSRCRCHAGPRRRRSRMCRARPGGLAPCLLRTPTRHPSYGRQ